MRLGAVVGLAAVGVVLVSALGTIDISGWALRDVVGVSDDGKVLAGSGNSQEAFVVHLP